MATVTNANTVDGSGNANVLPGTHIASGNTLGTVTIGGKTVPQVQTAAPSTAAVTPSTNTTTGGTSSTPATATLSPAAIAAINASIAGAIGQNQSTYAATQTTNANNDAQQQLSENTDLQNNTQSRATAIQNAEQAAASGNQGLKAVLASLGALGGTGQLLAGRAVANSANGDIGTADSTYTTNDEAIQQAIKNYQQQVAARDATLTNNLNIDNRNDTVTGLQNEIDQAQNIGDTKLVSQLLPQIAGATAPVQSIAPQAVLYNGANVGAYSPTNSVNVTAAPSTGTTPTSNALTQSATTPVNSALYTTKTNT